MNALLVRVAPFGLALAVLGIGSYNLTDYPTIWFDEGSYLHVPQTLVRYGIYADRSSEGFRYFGPTVAMGPTVMLPIAAAFALFGVGLLQARLVMVAFLAAATLAFSRLGRVFGGNRFVMLSVALLITSPSPGLLVTGRQALGEVPALFFLAAGLSVWFSAWEGRTVRLLLAGTLLGAAAVTKYQYLVMLAPALVAAGLANALYYRIAPARVFLWPCVMIGSVFAVWQGLFLLYIGPEEAAASLAALRESTAGAGVVFSPDAMRRAAATLLSPWTYGGLLAPALAYAIFSSLRRTREGQQWSVLTFLVVTNLLWFVVASIGWPRYAFPGLALAALLVARLLWDVFAWCRAAPDGQGRILQGVAAAWLLVVLTTGTVTVTAPILDPPASTPHAMSAYLRDMVPTDVVVETWEPELGVLSSHNYHYPPNHILAVAVRHIWHGGPPVHLHYHQLESERPPFVVVGPFAKWVRAYSGEVLRRDYALLHRSGPYDLYGRRASRTSRSAPD